MCVHGGTHLNARLTFNNTWNLTQLYVIGEHDFRVEHCLLALPGTKREDVKKVMSHPQALAQCDNYLRG